MLAFMEDNRDTVKPNSTVNKDPNMVKLVSMPAWTLEPMPVNTLMVKLSSTVKEPITLGLNWDTKLMDKLSNSVKELMEPLLEPLVD